MSSDSTPVQGELVTLKDSFLDVSIGPSTVLGFGVTLGAYVAAAVAILNGARDIETITLFAVGTVALVSTLVGRVLQAIALIKHRPVPLPVLEEKT